jgi:hypothetical protein
MGKNIAEAITRGLVTQNKKSKMFKTVKYTFHYTLVGTTKMHCRATDY